MKKWLTRIFTTKEWRGHRRRLLFEMLFEDIKDDKGDDLNWETFKFIRTSGTSYENSCHEMATVYDYNPLFDKYYRMNIGKFFLMYHSQNFDYLYARIHRITSPWKILLKKSGVFSINIRGKENGEHFDFQYKKYVKKIF